VFRHGGQPGLERGFGGVEGFQATIIVRQQEQQNFITIVFDFVRVWVAMKALADLSHNTGQTQLAPSDQRFYIVMIVVLKTILAVRHTHGFRRYQQSRYNDKPYFMFTDFKPAVAE